MHWATKVTPLVLFTALSIYLRHYKIGDNHSIIWDEAHFAKFGSYYNKHTFYHDVHPPLGKMLCGLSEWIVGFNTSNSNIRDYEFKSGSQYPDEINYYGMRVFQVIFSSLIIPVVWDTCLTINYSLLTSILITLLICLESSFIVLGKFVLLDSFLLFFMATTFWCLTKINKLKFKEGKSFQCDVWFILLGISIGCVCSIKWVGLFFTSVVGLYTIFDLWIKFWDVKFSYIEYFKFWIRRIVSLIIVPSLLYILFFKIHLDLLYLPGDGSGSMNTLFQANLRQTDIVPQPRFVQLNDIITLRSQGMNSNLLHSHGHIYPSGSRQHQITTYGFKDSNNNWRLLNSYSNDNSITVSKFLRNGDIINLQHIHTGGKLHSHPINGHISKNFYEVSGYGDGTFGDSNDNWVVEIISQLHSSNSKYSDINELPGNDLFENYIHPVSTTFRLRHEKLGCYLGTTGKSYPTWGFQQGEVVCLSAPNLDSLSLYWDTAANWNIESVIESKLPVDNDYSYPKSNFFKNFIQLQRSMAASNNALIPDPSKNDNIASSWWEWPLMKSGIRMSSWSAGVRKYYMFGNPLIIWATTINIPIFIYLLFSILIKWRNQTLSIDEYSFWKIFITAIIPLLGYIFNYLPFIIMGRVTYYHHYIPSLFFAIFMVGFSIDYLTIRLSAMLKKLIYLALYLIIITSFLLFSPTCLGMIGPSTNFSYLSWFPTWEIGNYQPFTDSVHSFILNIKKSIEEVFISHFY